MSIRQVRRQATRGAISRRTWMAVSARMRSGLVYGLLLSVALLSLMSVLFWVFERGANGDVTTFWHGFHWVARTLLQGEPPYPDVTVPGHILYYMVILTGVAIVAMATGAIASKLVEVFMRKEAGMGEAKFEGHIVICGWSPKGPEILRELHAAEVEDVRPVVILAELERNPTDDELTTFIRGGPSNGPDLLRAGIDKAGTAIVLADATNPTASADEMDAKTLLTTLAVESINPNCHTCVEVIRSENRQHFERTNADELVVSSEITGALLALSALHHGVSAVITDLITHPGGTEFYGVEPPRDIEGMSFGKAMVALKERYDCLVVALQKPDGEYEINPPMDRTIVNGMQLLVIAGTDPSTLFGDGRGLG